MNKTISNLLILGGINHIISYIPLSQLLNQIWGIFFIVFFIVILFKKNFSLFAPIQNKFTRITNYIEALGVVDYLIFYLELLSVSSLVTSQRKDNTITNHRLTMPLLHIFII